MSEVDSKWPVFTLQVLVITAEFYGYLKSHSPMLTEGENHWSPLIEQTVFTSWLELNSRGFLDSA